MCSSHLLLRGTGAMSGYHVGRAMSTLAHTSGRTRVPFSRAHSWDWMLGWTARSFNTSCCPVLPGARTGHTQSSDAGLATPHLPTLAIVYLLNFGHVHG